MSDLTKFLDSISDEAIATMILDLDSLKINGTFPVDTTFADYRRELMDRFDLPIGDAYALLREYVLSTGAVKWAMSK